MAQSRTLSVGMDGHKDTIAVAYGAQDHDAAVVSRGTFGTRQCDSDPLMRQLPAKAQHLGCVYDAGPCGAWLYRSLTTKDSVGWVGAPSLMPTRAGDRGTTARRDARPRARLLRSGDRTPVLCPCGRR
jgi:transposase